MFDDVVWHVSWNFIGDILAVSGGDNQVNRKSIQFCFVYDVLNSRFLIYLFFWCDLGELMEKAREWRLGMYQ